MTSAERPSTHSEDVLEWLHKANLKSLVPIFEREQLTDWSYFSRLSIPILQSLQIPLGAIFKLENALKEMRPDLRLSVHRDNDMKKVASNLFEWIRESQKNIDKQRTKHRPPWLGTSEKQRSIVANGFPPLENSLVKKLNEKSLALAVTKKKEETLGTPPKLRSITGVVSFPETSKIKKKPQPKIAPIPRIPSVSYPSIEDEILRYHRDGLVSESNDSTPTTHAAPGTLQTLSSDRGTVSSEEISARKVTINSQKPVIMSQTRKESTTTLYEPDFEEYTKDGKSLNEKKEPSKVALAIEEREKTPKEMVSVSSNSKKGHPKTIDPFSRKLKRFSKSPYVL